jgi:glycolate oxidase iron-sulfur subunit
MQTRISEKYKNTTIGQEADRILRNCVHCGFCTATCPTYQLLGDELDGPRGRIYLIKQIMEGQQASRKTMLHLDRCLTCRSCETTCPSGVEYTHLLDIGRQQVEQSVSRPLYQRVLRFLLRKLMTNRSSFRQVARLASITNPLLPAQLRMHTNRRTLKPFVAATKHTRSVLLLEGCVQPVLSPDINEASRHLLDRAGYKVISASKVKCCGAISHHLNAEADALSIMKQNIDNWWPFIEAGCSAIVSNASGCGVTLKEYANYFRHDAHYADKAARVSALCKDISELLDDATIEQIRLTAKLTVAFHAPCTLQHGLQLKNHLTVLLTRLGFELQTVPDEHLCCGSAGTYSILNSRIARQLRRNKLRNLCRKDPQYILTANIGCQHHLQSGTHVPVKHWVEVLAQQIA